MAVSPTPSSPVAPLPPLPAATTAAGHLSGNAVNALIHLYRAEMGRMTAYRARLDTTTNWAITTSALVATFALGNETQPHTAFVFLMGINYFFLHLEARRFGAYEGSRRRVRLLERYFYPQVLGDAVDPRWTAYLLTVLQRPVYPTVGLLTAVSWRLRRVYLWIYAGVLLAWLYKLDVSDWIHLDFAARAAVGSIPGWLICIGVAALYGWLVFVAARPGLEHPLSNPYADAPIDSDGALDTEP